MKPVVKSRSSEAIVERPKPPLNIIQDVPSYLQRPANQSAAGFEEVGLSDVTLPRLGLCQALTPQRIKGDPKHIQSLEEGQFFNTITQEIYGETVKIVPLLFFKNRILFKPKDDGGGILCRSDDNIHGVGDPGGECLKCPYSQFGSARGGEGKGTACSQFFNFPALVVEGDGMVRPEGLIVVSFKSSGLPTAKDWLALMRLRRIDMFGGVYELGSVLRKETAGTWYAARVANAGNASEATYNSAKMAYQAMSDLRSQGRLRTDVEDLDSGAGEGANAPF